MAYILNNVLQHFMYVNVTFNLNVACKYVIPYDISFLFMHHCPFKSNRRFWNCKNYTCQCFTAT